MITNQTVTLWFLAARMRTNKLTFFLQKPAYWHPISKHLSHLATRCTLVENNPCPQLQTQWLGVVLAYSMRLQVVNKVLCGGRTNMSSDLPQDVIRHIFSCFRIHGCLFCLGSGECCLLGKYVHLLWSIYICAFLHLGVFLSHTKGTLRICFSI